MNQNDSLLSSLDSEGLLLTTAPLTPMNSMDIPSFSGSANYTYSIFGIISSVSWVCCHLLSHLIFTLPRKLISTLSRSFQVTFSVYSLFFFLIIVATLMYTYIRYKYLTKYSRLPMDSKRQNPVIDTFIDPGSKDKGNQQTSYLDEFLSAIKLFGYLDSSVFHELTKSLQTQKLDSGEIIFLRELNGFTICVEGEIQVYSKIGNEDQVKRSIFYKEESKNVVIIDGERYQLLNIIRSGSPLSSIISVLDLLTDSEQTLASVTPTPRTMFSEKNIPLPSDGFALDPSRRSSDTFSHYDSPSSSSPPINSTIPEMIAIPKGNCTISIIPKESFTKIAAKYPKDASHIIQMILAKLYRVTFQTAHNYLDLTPDIYQTEINVNSVSRRKVTKLPRYLDDLAIDIIDKDLIDDQFDIPTINRRNKSSSNNISRNNKRYLNRSPSISESTDVPISSRSPSPSIPITNGSKGLNPVNFFSDGDEIYLSSDNSKANVPKLQRPKLPKAKSRHIVLDSRSTTNPGDLLSNVSLPRGSINGELNLKLKSSKAEMDELKDRAFFSDNEEETEELTLKTALAERISKMIGLDKDSFPLIQNYNNGLPNGPNINGIKYVKSDSSNGSNGKKSNLRTFSTNTTDTSKMANDFGSTFNSDIYKTLKNYENIQNEFINDIKLKRFPKNTRIVKSNESTPGLFYIIRGGLDVTYRKKETNFIDSYYSDLSDENKNNDEFIDEFLHHVNEGELAGYLGTLIGSKSFVDITTTQDTYVAFLTREFFEYIGEKFPRVELSFAHHLMKVMDKKLYFTDYALEWMHASAGAPIYIKGEPANGIYIVLNGRFRAIGKQNEGNNDKADYQILGEFGQGQSMGEIEVLTKSKRLSTVVAIRDGEVARIPRTLFEMIALTNPSIIVNISRIVANRVNKDGILMANNFNSSLAPTTHIKDEPLVQNFNNYRTLSLIPVSYGSVPIDQFAEKLASSLERVGKSVKILNQSTTLSNLGKYAFDKLAKLKLSGFFSELEEKYDIVIYLSDTSVNSDWTKTCIQQGDCILLLANAHATPDVGEYERLLVKTKTTARTELVLLHPEKYVEPGMTNKWLKNRIWVHSYHHIQMLCDKTHLKKGKSNVNQLDALTILGKKFTNNIKTFLEANEIIKWDSIRDSKYYQPMQEHKNDFMRLARLLTGQAIGLVLGGGGARGISHVGVIKALEDQGIPVDIIGGTSIGAFVGGLYAKDYDFVPVYGRAKTFSSRMASLWRSLLDLTIPLTSYITGHEFNRGIWKAFGDSRIEDFWITYYTNSTNLTQSVMEIHTSGYAWRYIRASMTLASLLPPMTDNGDMLMDGGYIDNLTVSEMQRRGVRRIIACDVGSEDEKSFMNYGDSLSGFWVLLNRLNPFSSHPNVPTMADIQMKLAYVASVSALEKAKKTKGIVYLRPPIEGYATLDFGKFDEIYQVGIKYVNSLEADISDELHLACLCSNDYISSVSANRRYTM